MARKTTPLTYEMVPVSDIQPHPDNARDGDVGAISQSIKRFGFYGACVVQKSTGYIIVGNHRYKAAVASGHEKIPVVFKDLTDAEAKALMVADNRTSDLATYDEAKLATLLQDLADGSTLEGTGFDGDDLDSLLKKLKDDEQDNPYTRVIELPIYEPKSEEPPPLDALVDTTKTQDLCTQIDRAELPEDLTAFLKMAAMRHARFDYQEIAEYYAHASPEVKSLMESSALVIVDADKAIEEGFVQLVSELTAVYENELEEG